MTLISNTSSLFIGTLIGYIIATRCTNTKKNDSSSSSSSSAPSLSDLFPPLSSNLSSIEFGSIIRSTLFALRPSPSIFLNHASYGTVPLPVIDAQQRLAIRVENHPDEWFRKDNWIITQQALKEISSFIHCPVSDLVFVNNATSAVNAVLLSIEPLLTSDDILFTLNTTYNACKLSMMHTADRTGAVYHEANLRFPLSSADDALQQIMETIDSLKKSTGKRIRFALFDLITSPTAIVMPYKELAAECRRRDILCFLDGAHAIGQLSLNLSEFDCDFLTTNLHKWLFAPKGAALFYCNPRLQESIKIHPVLTSHSYRDTFQQRFWMQGTRDDSSYISAVYGLRFATAVGIDRMKDYNRNLANWAENYLCKEWSCCKDTDHSHPLCPSSMSAPNMRVLRVPLSVPPSALQIPGIDEWNAGKLWAEKLMMILFERFDVIVTLFYLEGKLYCRFSSQIYNDKKDYQRLAEIIKIYKAEIEAENK